MSPSLLAGLVVVSTAAVIAAMFYVMWSARTSARTGRVSVVASVVLAGWAVLTAILASRGFYVPHDANSPPPVGIQLGIALVGIALCLVMSSSLRSVLTNQRHLIRLNVWRLLGVIFLVLMFTGRAPALWALPAGIGDIIVGSTAFWVASRVDEPGGVRLAVVFNIFGLADLIDAIALGIMSNPGSTQVFHPTPSGEVLTHFPMALVPGFLVPLAIMLHVVSLWQLAARRQTRSALGAPALGGSRAVPR